MPKPRPNVPVVPLLQQALLPTPSQIKPQQPLINNDGLRLSCETLAALTFGLMLSSELKPTTSEYKELLKKRRYFYVPLFLASQKLMKTVYPARATDWRTYAAWALGASLGLFLPSSLFSAG